MGILEEKEEIIDKVKNVSAIEFYKKLKLQIVIETKRLDIYLGQLNSISAVLEPNRAVEKNVQVRNQQALLSHLEKVEKDFAIALSNYGLTLNDKEAVVFSMGIIQNRSNEDIANYLNLKEKTVRNIKCNLKKELDDMIIYEQL